MKQLLDWWNKATPDERHRLARAAKTSAAYLRSHVITGARRLSAEKAALIEAAAAAIRRSRSKSLEQLPPIDRSHLCDACRMCPHARAVIQLQKKEG